MPIIDGYKLTMHAHCGMSYTIARIEETDADSIRQLIERAEDFVTDRIRRGYTAAMLECDRRWELTEPEDAMMVPDDAGLLVIEPIHARTVDCWNCGFEVRVGGTCDCSEPIEDTEER